MDSQIEMTAGLEAALRSRLAMPAVSDPARLSLRDAFLARFSGIRLDRERSGVAFIELQAAGLSLSEKIALEQFVRDELAPLDGDALTLAVYFTNRTNHRAYARSGRADSEPRLPLSGQSRLAGVQLARRKVPGVNNVLLVASGKGGVGKSTVSALLALAMRERGQRVAILDADLYGPSMPTLLGASGHLDVSDGNKLIPYDVNGIGLVSSGLIIDSSAPLIWRGPMLSKLLTRLFFEVEWDGVDTLVVDLPPGTGDVQLTILEQVAISAAVMVTTAEELAYADVIRAASMFRKTSVPLAGLIENSLRPLCSHCGQEPQTGGHTVAPVQLALQLGVPYLGAVSFSDHNRSAAIRGRIVSGEPTVGEIDAVVDRIELALI